MSEWLGIDETTRQDCESVGLNEDQCREAIRLVDQAVTAHLFGWLEFIAMLRSEPHMNQPHQP